MATIAATKQEDGPAQAKLPEQSPYETQTMTGEPGRFPVPETEFPVEDGGYNETEGFHVHTLRTSRGPIETRLYHHPEDIAAIVLLGGVGGGFDTPGRDLYPRLGRAFYMARNMQTAVLRVQFRDVHSIEEAVYDVNEGLAFLRSLGMLRFGLVGHCFGAAVAFQAAASNHDVLAVVAIASQTYGADVSALGGPNRSVLFLHGDSDKVLPHSVSQRLFMKTKGNNKQLEIFRGCGHCIKEGHAPEALFQMVCKFFVDCLHH